VRTVENVLDDYEHAAVHRGVKPTQMNALKPIRRGLGMLTLDRLTPSAVRAYTNERRMGCWTEAHAKPKAKDGTIRRELAALTAALNWASSRRIINAVDVPLIDLPPQSPARENFLNLREADAFWNAAQRAAEVGLRVGLFACLSLDTWARAASVETLTWPKIDLDTDRIDFRDLTNPATTKRRVPVPISPRLKLVLTEWRAIAANDNVVCGPVSQYDWRKFASAHGFSGLTRHDLRRTGISLAMARGVDPMKVAQMAGDDYETIMKHYARFAPDYLSDVFGSTHTHPVDPPRLAPSAEVGYARGDAAAAD
jgi:integrase